MMKKLAILLIVGLMALPMVSAEHPGYETVDAPNGETYYVSHDGSVYQETNGCDGLQHSETTIVPGCDQDDNGQWDQVQPDKRLTPF